MKNQYGLGILILLFLSSSLFASVPRHNSKILLVKLKTEKSLFSYPEIKRINHLYGKLYKLEVKNLDVLLKKLKNDANIEYVERDYYGSKDRLAKPAKIIELPTTKAPGPFNDPKIRKQWHLFESNKNGVSVLEAFQRRRTQPRETTIVAVVDTGVDWGHEDLKNQMWVNEGEIPKNGIDDDGNGIIDDIHGINTIKRDADGNPTGDMTDKHGHGTHVSGIIGASQNNGIGIAGVASNVKIMGIRAVPNSGDETDSNVIDAFLYAARNGAKVINCSFGKQHNEGGMAVSETIKHIGEKYGVLVVAASGNDGKNIDTKLVYPASFNNENLLVVASTTKSGGVSYFSNFGLKNVDIGAPGSSIYSTYKGDSYRSMSGTSMASPVVSGLAAELWSHFPELTPQDIKKSLMDNVVKKSNLKKKVGSGGRADLLNSLNKRNLGIK